jgi:hypothetical protein
MPIIVTAAYAAYILLDFRPAAKGRNPKIIWPCLILFGAGFVVQILFEMKISLPSPAVPISQFISGLFNLK